MSDCGCPCSVCEGGYHIFCNQFPHGDVEQAVRWFRENHEAAKEIIPRGETGRLAMEEAERLGPLPSGTAPDGEQSRTH